MAADTVDGRIQLLPHRPHTGFTLHAIRTSQSYSLTVLGIPICDAELRAIPVAGQDPVVFSFVPNLDSREVPSQRIGLITTSLSPLLRDERHTCIFSHPSHC